MVLNTFENKFINLGNICKLVLGNALPSLEPKLFLYTLQRFHFVIANICPSSYSCRVLCSCVSSLRRGCEIHMLECVGCYFTPQFSIFQSEENRCIRRIQLTVSLFWICFIDSI